MTTKYIMLLDTETANGMQAPMAYDIGYVVFDTEKMKIVKTYNKLVSEVWGNELLMSTAYYSVKIPKYQAMIENGDIEVTSYNRIIANILNTLDKYNIDCIYAYNSSFDERVFKTTSSMLNRDNKLGAVRWVDIQGYIARLVTDKRYKKWAEDNKLFTNSKRFYSTNAETVYKWLSADLAFIEDHMALSDCLIELQILVYARRVFKLEWNKSYEVAKFIDRGKNLKKEWLTFADGTKKCVYYTRKQVNGLNTIYVIE